jgi:hypothetical protein
MKKMNRFEDDGDVDYDKDSDAEAQKVYRSDLSEVSDSKRTPKRSAPVKKAAPKRGTKGHRDYFNAADPDMSVKGVRDDDGSYDRKEQRNAMMSGFGPNGRTSKAKVDDSREFRRLPEATNKRAAGDEAGEFNYKKGGSVKSSASKRADGIASRGKTKGRMI